MEVSLILNRSRTHIKGNKILFLWFRIRLHRQQSSTESGQQHSIQRLCAGLLLFCWIDGIVFDVGIITRAYHDTGLRQFGREAEIFQRFPISGVLEPSTGFWHSGCLFDHKETESTSSTTVQVFVCIVIEHYEHLVSI